VKKMGKRGFGAWDAQSTGTYSSHDQESIEYASYLVSIGQENDPLNLVDAREMALSGGLLGSCTPVMAYNYHFSDSPHSGWSTASSNGAIIAIEDGASRTIIEPPTAPTSPLPGDAQRLRQDSGVKAPLNLHEGGEQDAYP
jgi:hypothetical protein